jgi:hypothetical protein
MTQYVWVFGYPVTRQRLAFYFFAPGLWGAVEGIGRADVRKKTNLIGGDWWYRGL